jgi:hypothetical protein
MRRRACGWIKKVGQAAGPDACAAGQRLAGPEFGHGQIPVRDSDRLGQMPGRSRVPVAALTGTPAPGAAASRPLSGQWRRGPPGRAESLTVGATGLRARRQPLAAVHTIGPSEPGPARAAAARARGAGRGSLEELETFRLPVDSPGLLHWQKAAEIAAG